MTPEKMTKKELIDLLGSLFKFIDDLDDWAKNEVRMAYEAIKNDTDKKDWYYGRVGALKIIRLMLNRMEVLA